MQMRLAIKSQEFGVPVIDSHRTGYSGTSNRALGQTDYIRDTMRQTDTMKHAMTSLGTRKMTTKLGGTMSKLNTGSVNPFR